MENARFKCYNKYKDLFDADKSFVFRRSVWVIKYTKRIKFYYIKVYKCRNPNCDVILKVFSKDEELKYKMTDSNHCCDLMVKSEEEANLNDEIARYLFRRDYPSCVEIFNLLRIKFPQLRIENIKEQRKKLQNAGFLVK